MSDDRPAVLEDVARAAMAVAQRTRVGGTNPGPGLEITPLLREALDAGAVTIVVDAAPGARPTLVALAPLRDAGGAVAGVLAVLRPAPQEALLSGRELEVLRLAALGQTTSEIAAALFLAVPTVESHVRNAVRRLGARNRSHAIALALTRGDFELD